MLDPTREECNLKDVRRTVYWAMGEDPYTSSTPITIDSLMLRHRELLYDGEPWMEAPTVEQTREFLNAEWDGYAANRIFITFNILVG
jgi:hypothetical protein